MPRPTQKTIKVRAYVLKEHRADLEQCLHYKSSEPQFSDFLDGQNLVSVRFTTSPHSLPLIIQALASKGIPYDIHRQDGGEGYARFTPEGKFQLSANVKGKATLDRDWSHQREYRKRWATLKLINLIEDEPCAEPVTPTPSPTKRNPILGGKSVFSQTILSRYGKP